jgi:hypothetical protein
MFVNINQTFTSILCSLLPPLTANVISKFATFHSFIHLDRYLGVLCN